MRRFGIGIAAILILVVCAAPALAKGPYVGGQAGVVFTSDADLSAPGETSTAEFDTGWGLALVGGYEFDMFRVEGELFYKMNGVDTISDPVGSDPADGDLTALGLMVNAYYDFKTGAFTPYVGAGIGMAQLSIKDLTVAGVAQADDDDTVFAYQLIAGIGYSISPATTLDLAYKWTATTDPEYSAVDGTTFDAEYSSHNVMLGLRYKF